jgi:hypothetical protein
MPLVSTYTRPQLRTHTKLQICLCCRPSHAPDRRSPNFNLEPHCKPFNGPHLLNKASFEMRHLKSVEQPRSGQLPPTFRSFRVPFELSLKLCKDSWDEELKNEQTAYDKIKGFQGSIAPKCQGDLYYNGTSFTAVRYWWRMYGESCRMNSVK